MLGGDPAAHGAPSAIAVDLLALLGHYQSRYAGAMYSGCGGGYIYVVSEEPVPGSLRVKARATI